MNTAADTPDDANVPELLAVRLLFTDKPTLNKDLLAAALRREFKQVNNPDGGQVYFFPDYPITFADGKQVPASLMLAETEQLAGPDIVTSALQQCWHWEAAASVVDACRHEVIVTDFLTRSLNYKVRAELFQKAIDAFVEALQPQVIYFVNSNKLLEPQAYLQRGAAVLDGLLNVRFYNVANSDTAEMFVDTLGLHALGLPDFQIRFSELDPNVVVGLLTGYAYYIFEKGPVLEDGHTIQGTTPADKWTCYYADSQVNPERLVIELETDWK